MDEQADNPDRQAEQAAQARRELILRYKRLFTRDDGRAVWADLCEKFGFSRSLAGTQGLEVGDSIIVRREMMRQPLYYIETMRDAVIEKKPREKKTADTLEPIL